MTTRTADSIALERARKWMGRNEVGVFKPRGAGIDWRVIEQDEEEAVVITNNAVKATELCLQGQPAIAVVGVSERSLATMLRRRGARVISKKELS